MVFTLAFTVCYDVLFAKRHPRDSRFRTEQTKPRCPVGGFVFCVAHLRRCHNRQDRDVSDMKYQEPFALKIVAIGRIVFILDQKVPLEL